MKTKLKSILAIALCAVGLAAFAAETDGVQLWENGPYFATCNIGANAPQEYGYYFWWGDTVGYRHDGEKWVSADGKGTSIQFAPDDETAKTTEGKTNAELKSMGYINDDANPVLNAAHDAATAHLGEPWRMPTKDELDKLVANCEVEWTDNWNNTGVKGRIVKGKGAFGSNRIFLPATGYGSFFKVNFAGDGGHNGASTPDSDGSNAWCLNFNSSFFSAYKAERYIGSPVRAVKDPPTVALGEVTAGEPWSKITVNYTLGGTDAKTDYKVAFDITAGGQTASVTNAAAKVTNGATNTVVDTAELFSKVVVDPQAQVKVSLIEVKAPPVGQLWEGGPIWAENNVGKAEEGLPAAYGALYNFNDATSAITSLGDEWRLPTKLEFENLISNCDQKWGEQDGVKGRLFTGKGSYSSNSIFLPAAGSNFGSGHEKVGIGGALWSGTESMSGYGYYLYSVNNSVNVYNCSRSKCALSVRAVRGAVPEPKEVVVATGEAEFVLGPKGPKGSEWNPWKVGEVVEAWTNGTELVVQGAGAVTNLADVITDWGDIKGGLAAINVTSNGVTGAEAQAFAGVGTEEFPVALTLPDGWQGELPDEDGNWYGATGVTLATYPLAVKNVTFQQRYPWNGKEDVGFTLTGPAGETNVVITAYTNGTDAITNFTVAVTIPEDGVLTTNLVWDAMTAGLGDDFKSDDVTIEVAFAGGTEPMSGCVQLWENGPYFAECNIGANAPQESGYYFWWGDTVGYTNNGAIVEADKAWVSVVDGTTSIKFSNSDHPANSTYDRDVDRLKSEGWIDDSGNLVAAHDAATAKLGAPWRMMTEAEFAMLTNTAYCTSVWTNDYNHTGITGRIVTGNTSGYTDKSIFLPAAGYGNGSTTNNVASDYWSSTPNASNDKYSWGVAFNSTMFRSHGNNYRFYGFQVRAVRDAQSEDVSDSAPTISAKSAAGTVDVRMAVALPRYGTTVSNVTWSATLWGELDEEFVTAIGWTNLTTGATGVFSNLAGVVGEAAEDADLPKKDGDYRLTHSTGGLKSFVKFTVSGYPLGGEGNPWVVGGDADQPENVVTAWTNGTGVVYFKPVRGIVSKEGLETVTNAMGRADFPAKLVSADGTATNDLVMVLGASGTAYDTLADALAESEASYTLFEIAGIPYLDWDDENKKMTNAMCVVFEPYAGQTTLDAGKTYVVMGDVTNTTRITVNGTVESPTYLILCDGAKLTAEKGVEVKVNGATTNALVVCGQSEGEGTGALEATGGDYGAGIGSADMYGTGGTVTINGGVVTACGGYYGAGIGGGAGGACGSVTINGGVVTATGGMGDNNAGSPAGIGGGAQGAGDTVTINGGTVTATGGIYGAGIGGGTLGAGGSVTINGGVVTATGGMGDSNVGGPAGIGGGALGNGGIVTINGGAVTANGGYFGAGIGGGNRGVGGTVTISGGEVAATGGEQAAGIGGGNGYRGFNAAGGIVTISGGTVTATGGYGGAGIGGGANGDGATVTITGGTVTATGGDLAVGIGAGYIGDNDGTVTFGADKDFILKTGDNAESAVYFPQARYAIDHSAVYAHIESDKEVVLLKIPSPTVGFFYAVTNVTGSAEVIGTLEDGMYTCAFATNDQYEVIYALEYGYEWATAPAANPLTGTITADTELAAVAVKPLTYTVRYARNGAAGAMADDTFAMFETTNLTANAYTAVGYTFEGWTTNGCDEVAYADGAEGVNFAAPGETLALKAKWTEIPGGVKPADYAELTNLIAQATLPVTLTLESDITLQPGDKVVIPAGKDVTFTGLGKFDVSAERPALFDGYSVGTGLKPEDLDRFKTDKDVKAYYEDGKVVVRGRGETEEFPWLLGTEGHENEVAAWAIDGGILAKPTRGTASVAALQSVTNALSGYVPDPGELKVISADGSATNDVVMLLGSDGVPYDTLADVLAADPMPETVKLYEVKGASVEFNAMGGVHTNGREIETNFCIVTYTLPTVEREGYTLVGWYDSWKPDATKVEDGQDLLSYEPHSLYAVWSANKPMPSEGELDVPDVTNDVPVTSIEAKQYVNDASLKNVTTPLYLKSIGQRAFMGCTALEKLTITAARSYDDLSPVKVTVGQNAFSGCSSLDTVYIAAEIDNLGQSAFQNCAKLKKIVFLGDDAITYGASAFYRCGYQNGTGSLKVYMSSAFQAANEGLLQKFKDWNTQLKIIEKVDVTPVEGGSISIGELNTENLAANNRRLAILVKTSVQGTPDPEDVDVEFTTDISGGWTPLSAEKTANPDGTVLVEVTVPEGSSGFFRAVVK